MVQRSGDQERRRKEAKRQRNESLLGSYDFANEARGKEVAALDPSNSSIGHGRFRARPSDDHENSRPPFKRIEPNESAKGLSEEFVYRVCKSQLRHSGHRAGEKTVSRELIAY